MACARFIPSAVTSTRILAFPLLIFSLANELMFNTYLLFLVAIVSDYADGYIARKLGVCSDAGAILDTTVDFLFIGGMFLYFTSNGTYPMWTFILVVFMFGQFAVTSLIFKKVFDPIGKYYGSLLYGGIGLTILFSSEFAISLVTTALLFVSIVCLTSRIIFLRRKKIQ